MADLICEDIFNTDSALEPCTTSRLTTCSSVRLLLLPLDCGPITICNDHSASLARSQSAAGGQAVT
ncbi:hypothetical protein CRUP_028594 [Coryphaenoides rupestris]|nr:hypothetical protein CRUP_028594 [Coryphaenoides rupestris]